MRSRVLLVLPTKQNVRTSSKESNKLTSMILPTFLLIASLMLTGLRAEVTTGGDSPGCVSCGLPALDKEAEERLMIEVAKQQILSKLHLKERPNITHNTIPRVALLTALRKLQAGRVSNTMPTKDQGYEIVSFAETGELYLLSVTTFLRRNKGLIIQVTLLHLMLLRGRKGKNKKKGQAMTI